MVSAMSRPDPLALGVLLRQAHTRAASVLETALSPLPVGPRHFGVLLHLSRLGESTQKELLSLTGSDKAGMARTIDALAAAGFVTRQESTADRRVNRLTLTAAGAAITADALARARAAGQEMFGGFSAAELAQLIDMLQRFVASEDAVGGHAAESAHVASG